MFLPALVSESMGVKGGKILLLRVGIGGNGEVAFARIYCLRFANVNSSTFGSADCDQSVIPDGKTLCHLMSRVDVLI